MDARGIKKQVTFFLPKPKNIFTDLPTLFYKECHVTANKISEGWPHDIFKLFSLIFP